MDKCPFHDAFENARKENGILEIEDQNDPVKMVLRHKDVRRTAHNWKTFKSGARPGRIVVPSEVNIRDTRQIPFEVDPPEHKEYRSLIEKWFRRPLNAEYESKLQEQIDRAVDKVLNGDPIEVVHDFALPIQSEALTFLLNVPFNESAIWISWGTHVFRSSDNPLDVDKANLLYEYLDQQIEHYSSHPGEDLYSLLLNVVFQGRNLSHEEIKGILILTFAGGRDTIINALTNTIAYFSDYPSELTRIKKNPELIPTAVEEFIRYFSPLTQMGRVVTEDAEVAGERIKENTRVSLCWASANRDDSVFEHPNKVIIDRKMNPHVGFGFSHHKCLGAHHARQVLKTFISALSRKVTKIEALDFEENIEDWKVFKRKVGYHSFQAKFNA